jgi:CRP-like cAMP-binding protein
MMIARPSNGKSKIEVSNSKEKKAPFDVQAFLDSVGLTRRVMEYRKGQKIFAQGDAAKHVMYIQKGGIKVSVVNEVGKGAVVAILGPTDFFGMGCLAGQPGLVRVAQGHATPGETVHGDCR